TYDIVKSRGGSMTSAYLIAHRLSVRHSKPASAVPVHSIFDRYPQSVERFLESRHVAGRKIVGHRALLGRGDHKSHARAGADVQHGWSRFPSSSRSRVPARGPEIASSIRLHSEPVSWSRDGEALQPLWQK